MDVTALLISLGPLALVLTGLIVFVENGLLFPFLPGDSLIFAAAVMAGALHVPWPVVAAIAAVAAVAGGEVGFVIGRRRGRRLFRPDARVLKAEYLRRTDAFFDRWGRIAIVLARFVPVVRTFVAPAAGASSIRHRTFAVWNLVSAVAWAALLGGLGAVLGAIPWVAANIEWVTVGIILLTVVPIVVGALVRRRDARTATPDGAHRAVEHERAATRS